MHVCNIRNIHELQQQMVDLPSTSCTLFWYISHITHVFHMQHICNTLYPCMKHIVICQEHGRHVKWLFTFFQHHSHIANMNFVSSRFALWILIDMYHIHIFEICVTSMWLVGHPELQCFMHVLCASYMTFHKSRTCIYNTIIINNHVMAANHTMLRVSWWYFHPCYSVASTHHSEWYYVTNTTHHAFNHGNVHLVSWMTLNLVWFMTVCMWICTWHAGHQGTFLHMQQSWC